MKTSPMSLLALINHDGVVLSSYRDSAGALTIGVDNALSA